MIELKCKKCGKTFEVPLFSGQICTHCGNDNTKKQTLVKEEVDK